MRKWTLLGHRLVYGIALLCLAADWSAAQSSCTPDSTTLCLQNGRFQVRLTYTNGATSAAHAIPLTAESGSFWFFNSANAEVVVKVLDGTTSNGNYWVYHSPMTSLAYELVVTDLVTGISQTYTKANGSTCGDADTTTFKANPNRGANLDPPLYAPHHPDASAVMSAQLLSCAPSATKLCLQGGRFEVSVNYNDPNSGQIRAANTVGYSDESGFFTFFSGSNIEIGVKVLDALQGYGYYWVFIGGATHVGYTVKITDTLLGISKTFPSAGAYCGQSDLQAFGNPSLRLQQGSTVIARGSTIDLGSSAFQQSLTKTFTLYNDGNAPLAINHLTWNGTEISVVTPPPASIATGGSGTFTLAFGGQTSGSLTREIQVATTDLGPNPFRFNAHWTVANPIGPVIQMSYNGSVVSANQTLNLGQTGLNQPFTRTFTVRNVGDQPLTVAPIAITGAGGATSHFTVGQTAVSNLQPNQTGTFELVFDAAGLGSTTSKVELFFGGIAHFTFHASAQVVPPDFTLGLGPASRTVAPGQNAFYTVSAVQLYGFNQTIQLAVSGLPAEVATRLTPVNMPAGATSELRLTPATSIAPGHYPFTVTGTSGSLNHSVSATLVVEDETDFHLAVTPEERQVTQGGSATYAVTATALNGFSGSVSLSVSGLPANTSHQLAQSSITPGQSTTLELFTTQQTPVGDHLITVQGTGGGHSHTATLTLHVAQLTANTPEITGIEPNHIQGGQHTQVVLQGHHLQNGVVAIAETAAEPGDPLPSAFPTVSVVNIAVDGTSMTIDINATNPQVNGFYTLSLTTPGGTTGTVFRVVNNGPQVDAWSPSEPERGKTYQLLVMGYNLRNAQISSSSGGLEVVVLNSTSTQVNGFLFVADNAPLGTAYLTVTKNGISVHLPIEVNAGGSSRYVDHDLFGEQADKFTAKGEVTPEVYFQDLTFAPSLAVAQSEARQKGLCFVSLGWEIYSYYYTVLIPFDPDTGKVDINVLKDLILGESTPAGIKVLSAFVNLFLDVQFQCYPISHIQVCVYGHVGAEIPGIAGIILAAGGCFYGGVFIPILSTTGHIFDFNFSTSNGCATSSQQTTPAQGGNQRTNATLVQCCDSKLDVSLRGTSFPEAPGYSFDFEGFEIPTVDITPTIDCQTAACSCPGGPAHGASPLVQDATQVAPPNFTGPGKVRFLGDGAALSKYRIIPENLVPGQTLTAPVQGVVYESDGFLADLGPDCGKMWFKVGNGCSVTIQGNASHPVNFSGWYDCSVPGTFAGAPEWRDGTMCPADDNWHDALRSNPFAPACTPTRPSCAVGRAAVLPPNLILNPGFEDGSLAPFDQGVNNGSLSLEANPAYVHSGALSLRHVATGSAGSWSRTEPWNGNNPIDFAESAEDTYRFSAWVKAESPNTFVRLFLFSKDENGGTLPIHYQNKTFTVGTEWQQISLTHLMNPGYQYVTLRVDVRSPGAVWWDDLRLDAIDNLLEHPGFETDASELVIFSHAQNGSLALIKGQAHKGEYALQHLAEGPDSYTQFYLGSQAAGLTPIQTSDEAYRLSVWVKAEADTPIQLRIFGLDRAYAQVEIARTNATATTEWAEYSVTLRPSSESEFISIRLDNDGDKGAIVTWDDLVLERIHP